MIVKFPNISRQTVYRTQRALGGKGFSPEKPPKDPIEQKVKRINRFGLAAIGAILLTSYYLIKGNSKENVSMQYKNLPKKKTIVDVVATSNSLKIIENDDIKETSIRDRYNFINKVVTKCAPAVFYLEIRDPYKKDLETGEPVVTSNGSGFIISEDGWALTNAHVVLNKPQSTIKAVMRDGRSFKVQVEDADMSIDLALLKLEAMEKLPSLDLESAGDTAIGEWVVALGSPLSLSNSVTVGIVSCVDRPAEELGLKNFSMTYIQTDASITFGNSGGPLVNLDGNVIGINNLRLTSGISFAIPVEYAKKFLENSKYRIKSGRSTGPMGKTLLGITTIAITPNVLSDLLRESKIPKDVSEGLLVWKVIPGSPASMSGIEVGDIITHVNGSPVKKAADMYLPSSNEKIININLFHKGQKKNVALHPGSLE
ncbi:hypothetical protein JTB14_034190 [Gonioctena quinquepunctata]|nr:hypothetical protein JTB14_034190 [Gonioctena quinquepunctata]